MDKHTETFMKSIDFFRRTRIKELELEYDQTMRTRDNQRDFESIHAKLLEIIGEQNKPLLIELVDLAVAQYNTDPTWWYSQGFSDCQALYDVFRSVLMGAETIPKLKEKSSAELTEELDELINT
jgi:hypothetical protein